MEVKRISKNEVRLRVPLKEFLMDCPEFVRVQSVLLNKGYRPRTVYTDAANRRQVLIYERFK